ncbi:putative hydrolase [Gordonia araii NBRC 100433]|uniref:Putative hydrolase n=1 Tax=Gordonia araii NBRC 100433 TaxID=1073574 RepID=G7H605_9ACTN|nr:MazG family protein [Gordonia araii]GAB11327.1 putative hydrolase [Gordonia araii NBRC 100433]
MTVVLLDPQNPDVLPFAAAKLVNGPVQVTEDVAASVLWALPHAEVASGDDGDPVTVLISTEREHPFVVARLERGEVLLAPPPPAPPRPGSKLLDAVALMDHLRTGGPWESRQTHESLRRFLIEEVYELLDAIDVGTAADVRDELGDLLLQVLFHARVAADDPNEPFDIDDVAQAFIDKVTRRTPGVLSGEHSDLERQIADWEAAKSAERERGSILDGIVTTAPALLLTQKVLERVAAAGFPRSQVDPALLEVSVEMGADSVEDATRQRALDLMDAVFAAEARAAQDGITPATPEQWLYYLGVPAAPEPAAEPATAAFESPQSPPAPVETLPPTEAFPAPAYQESEWPSQQEWPERTDELPVVPPSASEAQAATDPMAVGRYFPPEPQYVAPESEPGAEFGTGESGPVAYRDPADLDPPITHFPTVIRAVQSDPIVGPPAQTREANGPRHAAADADVDSDQELESADPEPEAGVEAETAAEPEAVAESEEPEPEPDEEPEPPAPKPPFTIRESPEPEVVSTIPRPANADDLVGRTVRRPRPDEPSGRVIFTTEEPR